MARIERVRPVLLTARYEDPAANGEALLRLPSGYRTTGLVEITTSDGIAGLGEGYLAVFAPRVFCEIVELLVPVVLGRDPEDQGLIADIEAASNYWSRQGAARHVVSAIETALLDCRAQAAGIPVHELLGSSERSEIVLYGSGGDALWPEAMEADIDQCKKLGIELWKIRALPSTPLKARWALRCAADAGIKVGIDMVQSLVVPALSAAPVGDFAAALEAEFGPVFAFLEDPVGHDDLAGWVTLRQRLALPVAGGEIVTTPQELIQRMEWSCYDWVQPDATVVGGIEPAARVVARAQEFGCFPVVHAWGGPVGMLANYHAALAGGGTLAEWPLTHYELRDALIVEPWSIADGRMSLTRVPGLGARLTPQIEREFAFRPDAVYACLAHRADVPADSVWA